MITRINPRNPKFFINCSKSGIVLMEQQFLERTQSQPTQTVSQKLIIKFEIHSVSISPWRIVMSNQFVDLKAKLSVKGKSSNSGRIDMKANPLNFSRSTPLDCCFQ